MSRRSLALATLTLALAPIACNATEPPPEEESIQSTTQAVTTAVGTAVAFTAPIALADSGAPGDAVEQPNQGEVHTMAEQAVSASGIAMDPTCVTYSWQALTLTATFDHCQLAFGGAEVDGTIVLEVSTAPLGVEIALVDLMIDDASVDGTVGMYVAGTLGALELSLNADLAMSNAGSSAELHELSLTANASGATASGRAVAITGSESIDVTLTAVHWDRGLCLPVSGSLLLDDSTDVIVTFLPTTPQDGIVTVKIGSAPPAQMQIFQPCGSEA